MTRQQADIRGYAIEAIDGELGRVAKANSRTPASVLMIDTGPWIFGRTVALPAGAIEYLDHECRVVQLACRKEDIRRAPGYGVGGQLTRSRRRRPRARAVAGRADR